MNDFIEIPLNKNSLSKRKPIYGVGINDANYKIHTKVNGVHRMCPYYKRWICMLRRCYSAKFHENNPTYIGCKVCNEWMVFSVFKSWMEKQDWLSHHLDKDLMVLGNKIYSPDLCIFIPQSLNNLLSDSAKARGRWPIGVTFCKRNNKFHSYCNVEGKLKFIGYFATSEEASEAHQLFKSSHVVRIARQNKSNKRLYDALMRAAYVS